MTYRDPYSGELENNSYWGILVNLCSEQKSLSIASSQTISVKWWVHWGLWFAFSDLIQSAWPLPWPSCGKQDHVSLANWTLTLTRLTVFKVLWKQPLTKCSPSLAGLRAEALCCPLWATERGSGKALSERTSHCLSPTAVLKTLRWVMDWINGGSLVSEGLRILFWDLCVLRRCIPLCLTHHSKWKLQVWKRWDLENTARACAHTHVPWGVSSFRFLRFYYCM